MWKPISGFEAFYGISSDGRVKRFKSKYARSERVVNARSDKGGYLRVSLSVASKVTIRSVHGMVAEAFLGPREPGMTVNHMDCNKHNNDVSNLEYLSRTANTKHAVLNGRISLSGAKLTPQDVRDIRARYVPRTGSSAMLAKQYGITRRSVCRIISGQNWSHVS